MQLSSLLGLACLALEMLLALSMMRGVVQVYAPNLRTLLSRLAGRGDSSSRNVAADVVQDYPRTESSSAPYYGDLRRSQSLHFPSPSNRFDHGHNDQDGKLEDPTRFWQNPYATQFSSSQRDFGRIPAVAEEDEDEPERRINLNHFRRHARDPQNTLKDGAGYQDSDDKQDYMLGYPPSPGSPGSPRWDGRAGETAEWMTGEPSRLDWSAAQSTSTQWRPPVESTTEQEFRQQLSAKEDLLSRLYLHLKLVKTGKDAQTLYDHQTAHPLGHDNLRGLAGDLVAFWNEGRRRRYWPSPLVRDDGLRLLRERLTSSQMEKNVHWYNSYSSKRSRSSKTLDELKGAASNIEEQSKVEQVAAQGMLETKRKRAKLLGAIAKNARLDTEQRKVIRYLASEWEQDLRGIRSTLSDWSGANQKAKNMKPLSDIFQGSIKFPESPKAISTRSQRASIWSRGGSSRSDQAFLPDWQNPSYR